nr:hypothetical protein [Mesorhizobium hawassense]
MERVLRTLQLFDPPNFFARSLSKCLEIQLRQQDRFDPAMAALVASLELLAKCDFKSLTCACRVDEDDLHDMLHEIRALDPKPGNQSYLGRPEAIILEPSPGGRADGKLSSIRKHC